MIHLGVHIYYMLPSLLQPPTFTHTHTPGLTAVGSLVAISADSPTPSNTHLYADV